MKRLAYTLGLMVATALPAAAQHEGHQMAGMAPQGALDAAQCARNAQQARSAAQAAMKRLEQARQTNDAGALRTAIDDLSGALGFIQARLDACATPATAPVPQGATPETPMVQPGGSQPASAGGMSGMSGMDHSKMNMPAPSKPEAPKSAPDPMAGMDHSKMGHDMPSPEATAPGGNVPSPACKVPVDPKTSPKAEYEGKTYYFCSESDRQKFLANPAKYIKGNPK